MQMSFLLEYCHYLQREYRNSYLSSYRNLIEVLHLSVYYILHLTSSLKRCNRSLPDRKILHQIYPEKMTESLFSEPVNPYHCQYQP